MLQYNWVSVDSIKKGFFNRKYIFLDFEAFKHYCDIQLLLNEVKYIVFWLSKVFFKFWLFGASWRYKWRDMGLELVGIQSTSIFKFGNYKYRIFFLFIEIKILVELLLKNDFCLEKGLHFVYNEDFILNKSKDCVFLGFNFEKYYYYLLDTSFEKCNNIWLVDYKYKIVWYLYRRFLGLPFIWLLYSFYSHLGCFINNIKFVNEGVYVHFLCGMINRKLEKSISYEYIVLLEELYIFWYYLRIFDYKFFGILSVTLWECQNLWLEDGLARPWLVFWSMFYKYICRKYDSNLTSNEWGMVLVCLLGVYFKSWYKLQRIMIDKNLKGIWFFYTITEFPHFADIKYNNNDFIVFSSLCNQRVFRHLYRWDEIKFWIENRSGYEKKWKER